MQQLAKSSTRKIGWGIFASALVHAVFAALLIFGVRVPLPDAPPPESVAVELVPPPEEEPKPEEAKPEEPKAEEQAKAEPPPPEPEKPEEKPPEPQAEEQPAAPPPSAEAEDKPPEPAPPALAEKPPEEKPAEPPQPAAPPLEEKPVEPPKPPEPPPPEQAPPETSPTENEQAADQQETKGPQRVLKPVFEFGENEGGPRKSEDGDASVEGQTEPAETADEPAEDTRPPATEEAVAEDAGAADKPSDVPAPGTALPDGAVVPDADVSVLSALGAAGLDAAVEGTAAGLPPETTVPMPTPKPVMSPKKAQTVLTEAKTLFSTRQSVDPVATTAIGSTTPGQRTVQLCATELREQLRHARYSPEFIPYTSQVKGTVWDARDAAFRADGEWYALSFRCTLNAGATKVETFAFDVGQPIPRSDWQRRGIPAF